MDYILLGLRLCSADYSSVNYDYMYYSISDYGDDDMNIDNWCGYNYNILILSENSLWSTDYSVYLHLISLISSNIYYPNLLNINNKQSTYY